MKQPPYLCFAGKAVSFIGIVVQIVRVRIVDFDKNEKTNKKTVTLYDFYN